MVVAVAGTDVLVGATVVLVLGEVGVDVDVEIAVDGITVFVAGIAVAVGVDGTPPITLRSLTAG
jgi:hypothetical protein